MGLALLGALGLFFVVGASVFTYYSVRFSRLIDERLTGQVFQNTSSIYTAPRRIAVGEPLTPRALAGYLQRAGYTEVEVEGARGRYRVAGASVEVRPAANSLFRGQNALRVDFSGGQIARLRSLSGEGELSTAELEPELLSNLFDSAREKRRLVRFDDLPPVLVDAMLSAEDKRFFEHPGFDPVRILAAFWADVRSRELAQGASTITMQVARSYFFSTERTWRRKLAETLVALQLEQRFSKQQIFELYANQIYMGNRGSFAIRGFGEAARAYFGKDVRELQLNEAAFLAGILRAPNRYSSAERNPARAAEARDRVLALMVENRKISPEQAEVAKKAPLRVVRGTLETSAAPYFVDMVKDHLLDRYTEAELLSRSLRIYTTLDPELQRAAAEAVDIGLENVDKQLARRYESWRRRGEPAPRPQVALVALDPRTGEIRALIGGRDYGQSQLNHALARRQPGSVFKPFVYAAAFDNSVEGFEPEVTPITTITDEPTTFYFENIEYAPNNYGQEYRGKVTVREALRHSLNVATVKVAEMIGYQRVVDVARQMGLDPRIQATPAVALGAYEMSPLEVAAGYTVFASGGARAEPIFLRSVVASDGTVPERVTPKSRAVLDPRVAYLVTNLLEDVLDRGTAAGVRARGFTAPAAGKTGTSHDGWFAGYTANLLCVVWVGFDDNRELGLSGASSAAPIWAEFMKRAVPQVSFGAEPPAFPPPEGVVTVTIDPQTMQWATPECPETREEVFISGTEPTQFCSLHGGRYVTQTPPSWLSRIAGQKAPEPPRPGEPAAAPGRPAPAAPGATESPAAVSKTKGEPGKAAAHASASPQPAKQPAAEPEKKKGILRRIFGIFGGGKKDKDKDKPPPPGR
jgi:penicillin-binding protein 1B